MVNPKSDKIFVTFDPTYPVRKISTRHAANAMRVSPFISHTGGVDACNTTAKIDGIAQICK